MIYNPDGNDILKQGAFFFLFYILLSGSILIILFSASPVNSQCSSDFFTHISAYMKIFSHTVKIQFWPKTYKVYSYI